MKYQLSKKKNLWDAMGDCTVIALFIIYAFLSITISTILYQIDKVKFPLLLTWFITGLFLILIPLVIAFIPYLFYGIYWMIAFLISSYRQCYIPVTQKELRDNNIYTLVDMFEFLQYVFCIPLWKKTIYLYFNQESDFNDTRKLIQNYFPNNELIVYSKNNQTINKCNFLLVFDDQLIQLSNENYAILYDYVVNQKKTIYYMAGSYKKGKAYYISFYYDTGYPVFEKLNDFYPKDINKNIEKITSMEPTKISFL